MSDIKYDIISNTDGDEYIELLAEGGYMIGAIAAYQAMLYGSQKTDPAIRDQWRKLLLDYCKLDTLAMVMIYWHWESKLLPTKLRRRK